jgi:hypothetical protein
MRMLGCVSPPTEGELTILGADPVLGAPSWNLLRRAAYLVAVGLVGLALAGRRIAKLLLV